MALLENKSIIIPTVLIDLRFEDGIRKVFPVEIRDIINVTFNKKGIATSIQGKVTSINAATTNYTYYADGICKYDTTYATNKNGPYIVVDGSDTYAGKSETIYIGTIIDCDMISKWSDNFVVTTPQSDKVHNILSINQIRLNDGKLEVSTDFGTTWIQPGVNIQVNLEDQVSGILKPENGGTGRDSLDYMLEDIGAQKELLYDEVPTEGSNNNVSSGGIYQYIESKINPTT